MKANLAVLLVLAAITLSACIFSTMDITRAEFVPGRSDTVLVAAEVSSGGPDRSYTWTINWDDGFIETWSGLDHAWPKQPNNESKVALLHTYSDDGEYTVTLRCKGIVTRSVVFIVGADED